MTIIDGSTSAEKFWNISRVVMSVIGLGIVIDHVFMTNLLGDTLILSSSYLYALLAVYLSLVFLYYSKKENEPQTVVPWYDALAFLAVVVTSVTFIVYGREILSGSWQFEAPTWALACSVVLLALVLEACRRVGGFTLMLICVIFLFYPVVADRLPGFLEGQSFSLAETIGFHVLSMESVVGLPIGVVGDLVVGYIVFGSFLVTTGGGDFFYALSVALLGRQRGGPAKVAVMASGLFGSMSGSAVSNVITTGTLTIPAMKRAGYSPSYAAAIEACAATGGMLMPPIMGSTAFVMAMFLHISYFDVVIAAVIPSLLYYMGLFFQVDGYAAKHNIKGLPPEDLPAVGKTLLSGWPYLFSFGVLIVFLIFRLEAQAPFYASVALWIAASFKKETRPTLRKVVAFLDDSGRVLSNLVGLLASVGLIMGALTITGAGAALSRELLLLAGNNGFLMLAFGALACLALGLGMTVTASYIFLAIVMSPGLESLGYNLIAVHMFILYYAVTSNITPPVAFPAFIAAGIAKAPQFKTGFLAMRLGIVMFLAPFFFVLRPELCLQGRFVDTIIPFALSVLGVILLAGGLEGFVFGFSRSLNWVMRAIFTVGGFLLMAPFWQANVIALVLVAGGAFYLLVIDKRPSGSGEIAASSVDGLGAG